MKTWTKCQSSIPETSFNKSRRNKNGLRAECRDCQKQAGHVYRGPTAKNFGGGRYLAKVSKSLIGNKRRKGIPHTPEIKAKIADAIRKARALKFWSTKKK